MAEAIARMEQGGDAWHVPLLRAAAAGAIRVAFVQPGQTLGASLLDMVRRPRPFVVVLAGDDDTAAGAAPDAFLQARKLLRWAGFIVLHGTGGEAWHYAMAAETAMLRRRVVIVETTTATLPEWIALKAKVAARTPGIVLAVPPGEPAHPRLGAPAGAVVQ